MKYGCCMNMLARVPGEIGIEYLEIFRDCGYDYVELPLAEIMDLPKEEYARIVAQLSEAGIPCESCNNFFPPTMRLTGPTVDSSAVYDYVDRALTAAGALGAKNIVFGSGGAKRYPEGFPKPEAYAQIVRLLQYVDGAAARHGITISIEPLRRAECNIINTFEEGVMLARDVGGTQIKVLVDIYHLTEEREPAAHIEEYGAYLSHVHFANPVGRVFPIPEDGSEAVYHEFCSAVLKAGYNSRVSCEAYTTDVSRDAPKALQLLQHYFDHNERK
jgi:D-psicose/D-tagatose/L-ribulose 3-epimerase